MNAPDPQYTVVIPDQVMTQINTLPPEAVDELAAAIARIKADPEAAEGSRALVPYPPDPDRAPVAVPATRSISYLRNAVGDISPPTVAVFDTELREDVTGTSPDIKVRALRQFLCRWIEYIALLGDPANERRLDQADTPDTYADVFTATMEHIHREQFPDATPGSLAVRITPHGTRWRAVCPITMIRTTRDTEDEATLALKLALLELVTGY